MGLRQSANWIKTYRDSDLLISGSFAPNNTSNPVAASNLGDRGGGIWSVLRTSAGLFTVTFADTYFGPCHADCELWAPAATPNWAQIVGLNPTNAIVNSIPVKSLQIRVVNNAGTATDVGPTTGLVISFVAWVQDGYQK